MTNFGKLSNFCKKNKYTLYVIAKYNFPNDPIILEVRIGDRIVKEDKQKDIESASEILCHFFGLAEDTQETEQADAQEEDDDYF